MRPFSKTLIITALACVIAAQSFSQESSAVSMPGDYLSKEFDAGRRRALRELMPANSVAVIFAYPERVFSQDVNYFYHPNPDLYYFSGYKETSAILVIFKEMQHGADGDYNELFFVQRRDPAREQWTGKRLGIEGVKSQLGFNKVYNSEEFENFKIDLKKYLIMYDALPDDAGNMRPLIDAFKSKAGLPDIDGQLLSDLSLVIRYATPQNLPRILDYLKPRLKLPAYKSSVLLQGLLARPDHRGLQP